MHAVHGRESSQLRATDGCRRNKPYDGQSAADADISTEQRRGAAVRDGQIRGDFDPNDEWLQIFARVGTMQHTLPYVHFNVCIACVHCIALQCVR